MTNQDEIARLIEDLGKAAERATPGDWYQAGLPWFHIGSGVLAGSPDPHVGYVIIDTEPWAGERDEYLDNGGSVKLADPDDDAAYIVAAQPRNIRTLLSALATLTAERDAAEARAMAAEEELAEHREMLAHNATSFARAQDSLAEARAVIEPFGKYGSGLFGLDEDTYLRRDNGTSPITIGDFRHAAAFIEKEKKG